MSSQLRGKHAHIVLSAGLLIALFVIGITVRPSPAVEPTGEKERPPTGDSLPPGFVGRLGSMAFRHADPVNALNYTPDGKRLVTAANDQVIRIWEVATGKLVQEIHGAESTIASLAVSPDGKQLAANESAGKLRVWDLSNGKELWTVEQPDYSGSPLRYSRDGKFLTGWYAQNGGTIRVCRYDSATGKEVDAFEAPSGNISHITVSRHARVLALAGAAPEAEKPSTIVTLYNLAEHRRTRAITVPGQVTATSLSADSRSLVVATGRNIHAYETATGKEWHKMRVARSSIVRVFFTPDGRRLGAQGQDGDLRTWDLETGEFEQTIRVQDTPPSVPTGAALISPVAAAPPDATDGGVPPPPMIYSPDGKTLAAASGDRSVRFWDLTTGKERSLFDGHRGGVTALAISPDGKLLASGGTDQSVRVWDVARLKEVACFWGHMQPVTALAFSADGKQLTTGSAADGNVRVWDIAERKELNNIDGKSTTGRNSDLALSADGRRFAVGVAEPSGKDAALSVNLSMNLFDVNRDEKIRGWSMGTLSLMPNFANFGGQFGLQGAPAGVFGMPAAAGPLVIMAPVVAFGPAGKTVAATSSEGVSWYSVDSGKRLGTFATEPLGVQRIIFSSDGKTMAISTKAVIPLAVMMGAAPPPETDDNEAQGQNGSVVIVCDVTTGKERARVEEEEVGGLAFSPDGRLLVVGGADYQAHLWDAQTGRRLGTLKGHVGAVNTFAFSADGKTLASGSEDSTILIWELAECLKKRASPAVRQGQEEAAWNALIGESPAEVRDVMRSLSASPAQAVSLVSAHVRPIKHDDPRVKQVGRLVADLDSADFEVREKASKELEGMGEFATTALEKAMENNPSLEVRQRLEQVLAHIEEVDGTGEFLAALRSIELLERMGTPEARKLLQRFADGAPEARRTTLAREVLERLTEAP